MLTLPGQPSEVTAAAGQSHAFGRRKRNQVCPPKSLLSDFGQWTRRYGRVAAAASVPGAPQRTRSGGLPTQDGAQTRRSLLRADDLAQLTAEGLTALRDYGVATVLDLRWPEEAAQHPSPVPRALPEVRYERVSLLTHTEDEWRLRSRDVEKELWKCVVLERARLELKQVLHVIAAAAPGPLLFHCIAGKDRTGLIAALLLALADVTPEAIAHDYAMSSENLREGYLERHYAEADPARILEAIRCPEPARTTC